MEHFVLPIKFLKDRGEGCWLATLVIFIVIPLQVCFAGGTFVVHNIDVEKPNEEVSAILTKNRHDVAFV